MRDNIIYKLIRSLKNILTYKPPQLPEPFVLTENEGSIVIRGERSPDTIGLLYKYTYLINCAEQTVALLTKAKQLLHQEVQSGQIADYLAEYKVLQQKLKELSPVLWSYTHGQEEGKQKNISPVLEENEGIVKQLYHLPDNCAITIRKFKIPSQLSIKAMLVFVTEMVDTKTLNFAVLKPLMHELKFRDDITIDTFLNNIEELFIPVAEVSRMKTFADIDRYIDRGSAALFIDGCSEALMISMSKKEQRSIDRPQMEQTIRGAQNSFIESLKTNETLIRNLIPTSDLVTEYINVGDRIQADCAIMYLKSLANPSLVKEVKRRILGIKTDYVLNAGILEQFIEDHPNIWIPQSLSTERPDRVALHLTEGRVAILLNGDAFAHIVPVTIISFFHTVEDATLKLPAGTFMRVIRVLGAAIMLLLPAIYLSVSYYHQEALPTELALAVAGAREKVPFPAFAEIAIMEFAFELLREAGLRIPGLLGPTIGIVGAIIIGQAAVAANIVSPIVVIVVAVTGLASFAIPDYRLSFALRMMRFIYLFLAVMMGMVGVIFGLVVFGVILCNMKSFGVPFMAPVTPRTTAGLDVVVKGSVFRQETRPDEINPMDNRRQPPISKKWLKE